MQFNRRSLCLYRQLIGLAAAGFVLCNSAWAVDCSQDHWVTAWEAPPSDAQRYVLDLNILNNFLMGPNQSFREVFSPLGHGSRLRLKFSNRFSRSALIIKSATLARQTKGANVDAATLTAVRFNKGQASITIPAGEEAFSDPVDFTFAALDNLAVSVATGWTSTDFVPTEHFLGLTHSYVSLPYTRDHTADSDGGAYVFKTTRRHLVTGMEALATPETTAVVTLGDSLTDGYLSGSDKNWRYPDFLKRRIDAEKMPFFVANAGIGGNGLRGDSSRQYGPSALNRYGSDVLQQSGVTNVIIFEGINDIGGDKYKAFHYRELYNEIISAYQTLITDMQSHGLRVLQGTLTPAGHAINPFYSGPVARQLRNDVNWWIRNRSPADAIIDFDAAVRSPFDPNVIDSKYDAGDGLHFNAAGYAKLAATVDLTRLRGSACR